jgi:hypothetical protein
LPVFVSAFLILICDLIGAPPCLRPDYLASRLSTLDLCL